MCATPAAAAVTIQSAAYKDQLLEIANRVNAASGMRQILATLKDRIPALLGCENVTVYALDVKVQQLYTLMKAGEGIKEIRIPKNFTFLAGFAALSKKLVNIQDAYNTAELQRIHSNLRFDRSWDEKAGFRTKEVLAAPILFEKYLMGVLQAINKKDGNTFTGDDEAAIHEITRILGVALYNQRRVTRQTQPNKFGYLIDKGIISEKQLNDAVANARVNALDIGSVLHH